MLYGKKPRQTVLRCKEDISGGENKFYETKLFS
jgi:hypothetical protein